MKFFTIFAAILSVAFGYQASWTLDQLSQALESPNTDPSIKPYLEQALDQMMNSLISGEQVTSVTITIPAVDLSTWSLAQVSAALENPTTDPILKPYLEDALNQMMEAIVAGEPVVAASVVVPAMDLSSWTLYEVSSALEDPSTHPALIPLLENALNEMMHALMDGNQIESIVIAVPVGVLPGSVQEPEVPVVPVAPIDAPVVPSPVSPPATSASPLVQIVVNVNAQAAPSAPSAPVIPATPITEPASPVVVPDPVIVETPVIGTNPIDVIAIAAPEINPVDLIHPVGIVAPVAAGGDIVGPIV